MQRPHVSSSAYRVRRATGEVIQAKARPDGVECREHARVGFDGQPARIQARHSPFGVWNAENKGRGWGGDRECVQTLLPYNYRHVLSAA